MSSWISNDRIPKADMAVKIATALGLSTEFLVTGASPSHMVSSVVEDSATVKVPFLPHTGIPEYPMLGKHIMVPKSLVHHHTEASLGAVQIRGDSMIDERMMHGDVVIFIHGSTRGEGLHVLDVHGDILIRRVQFNPYERTVTLLSSNQRYNNSQTVPMDHDHVHLLGKVVAWFHRNI